MTLHWWCCGVQYREQPMRRGGNIRFERLLTAKGGAQRAIPRFCCVKPTVARCAIPHAQQWATSTQKEVTRGRKSRIESRADWCGCHVGDDAAKSDTGCRMRLLWAELAGIRCHRGTGWILPDSTAHRWHGGRGRGHRRTGQRSSQWSGLNHHHGHSDGACWFRRDHFVPRPPADTAVNRTWH